MSKPDQKTAAGSGPVVGKEICQLTAHAVDKDNIKFKNVSLQSNLYVTVREEGKNSVAIIDTTAKTAMRLPVAVDSAIMNPVSKVVALRGKPRRFVASRLASPSPLSWRLS
jgi:clathrin heavy chain